MDKLAHAKSLSGGKSEEDVDPSTQSDEKLFRVGQYNRREVE
jgi:hypothetical protein